jgi:hypothetical protein
VGPTPSEDSVVTSRGLVLRLIVLAFRWTLRWPRAEC